MINDHINGDATNNNLSNLIVLCPMCDTIRHAGLAGINKFLEVRISNLTQLEIVKKTREFYLQNKRFPLAREIYPYSRITSLLPIDVATLEIEEIPLEWKNIKDSLLRTFFKRKWIF